MKFGYKSSEKNEIPVKHLLGDLIDKAQAKDLIAECEKDIAAGKTKFVFDFSKLKYINSNGLSVLLSLFTKARKADGDILICSVNKKVEELLLITKLNTIFTVTDDLEKAVKKIK